MKGTINKIFVAIVLLCFILPLTAEVKQDEQRNFQSFIPSTKEDESNENKRKADYIVLEALRLRGADSISECFEMLRHAYRLDPNNSDIAYLLGEMLPFLENPTEERYQLALSLMKKHYDEYPESWDETFRYAQLAQRMGKYEASLEAWKTLASLRPNDEEVMNNVAYTYAGMGNYQAAIDMFDSVEYVHGKKPYYTIEKVRLYNVLNDTSNVFREVYSLIESHPKDIQSNMLASTVFGAYSKLDSALVYLDRALELDPDNGNIMLEKARLYGSMGDSINYDKEMYKALTNNELSVEPKLEALLNYSRDLLAQKAGPERARALFDVLVEEHPHESQIHQLYGQYLWTYKDYKGAAEQIGYALDIDPTNTDNWEMKIYSEVMSENVDKAIEAGKTALKFHPKNSSMYELLSQAYYTGDRYEPAMEMLDSALIYVDSLDYEKRSSLLTLKGDVLYKMGDTIPAFELYEKAILEDPGNIMAKNNFAYFLALDGRDLEKAERYSASTIAEDPENPTYLDTYAWVLFRKANYKEALVYIEKTIANSKPEDMSSEVIEHYGDILFMNGRPEEALEQWKKALEEDAENELLQRKVKHKTYFFK